MSWGLGMLGMAVLALAVGAGSWTYRLGYSEGLRRAYRIALQTRPPSPLGPMPADRAWRLGAEHVAKLIDDAS